MRLFVPQLSRVRTVLFVALAFVWFSEMVFLGFQSFSKVWTHLWQVILPENPQLAATLYVTWAIAAPAKGAFCVMAVFGLGSSNPSTRATLFASMALVPPLNIAFPFRQQGFLLEPVMIATVLSIILWGSWFLFRDAAEQSLETGRSGELFPSGGTIFQFVWLAANSAALTLMAFLFLLWPRAALNFIFPCLSGLLNTDNEGLSSLIHTVLAGGTHLLALATASWIATANFRSNPSLRQAVTAASAVHAALFLIFPLRQIIQEFGGNCAATSILVAFVPLFLCWVFLAVFASREERPRTAHLIGEKR
jgi:hypothetical protein